MNRFAWTLWMGLALGAPILGAAILGAAILGTTAMAAERPNIVIVLVDDMGYSDVGCYGGEIETPNIDGLAENGLRFTQFYNSGRCCPTRASLMTGLHPHQVGIGHMTAPPGQPLGITGPYQGYLNNDCVTIAQVLKSSGYHTMMTGKWHLGIENKSEWPLQRGFDRFYGGLSGAFNYFQPGGDRGIMEGNEAVTTDKDFYATDTFTDKACQYISEAVEADGDQPFFLYLAYNAPHWPLNAKLEDFQKYKGKYTGGWDQLMKDRLAKQQQLGLFEADTFYASHEGPQWDSLGKRKRNDMDSIMAAYAGCIDSIDQNIGKLTRHLRRVKQYDNTLIFFLSDNGACQEGGMLGKGSAAMVKDPPLKTVDGVRLGQAWANACNTPFRLYKHFVHEGGACTPMIAHWPQGIPATRRGGFYRGAAYLPDFMATCIDLSGAEYPSDKPAVRGQSLVPVLHETDPETDPETELVVHQSPMYWEHEGNAAMRMGPWKLVRQYQQPWELYDLDADRTELNNLAEVRAEKRDEMVEMWEIWATKTGVAFPERFNMYEHLKQKKNPAKDDI
ncbi:Arylsulfatase [Rubripirellula lacrimiformis]|uniref:Arylsulfatase n=1 Tax=Rubripirellula lacrimiformis TaxID=1930273 RepID=A0A517NHI0_9BACT|nr:arylsulfatase [Rubripirellula lacrimiformis]QDT06503.1 Arylsulfatase [Rubripirellula lacrimiformis]